MFGWQASNEGRALMVVSKDDVAITGTSENPQLVQWDVPLGEIYPRNSVRKSSPMGVTPSPSEYVRIVNNSVTPSSVQIRYITVSSPVYEQWPPNSHRRLLGVGDEEIDEAARAGTILQRLMLRAWRGNVTAAEVATKVQRFKQFRASSGLFRVRHDRSSGDRFIFAEISLRRCPTAIKRKRSRSAGQRFAIHPPASKIVVIPMFRRWIWAK